MQAHSFVAVVGPSGSGKSSLVFAGLLPDLRRQANTMWSVVTLRPGERPLHALAEAFGTAPADAGPARIEAALKDEVEAYRAGDADMLAGIVGRRLDAMPGRPDRLLIYVDQWEELYAMAPAAEDKERLRQHSSDVEKFIALLIGAASGARPRASVVLTVRADFYNPFIRSPLISALLPRQQMNIPLMGRENLRSVLEAPAKTAGLSFAPPELVDRILDDVGLEEGRLPLLQFALKETWERRAGDKLTADAYTAVGGVAGAIEKTAQRAYEKLTPEQQEAARRLFLCLVTPGEGQEDTRARSVMPDDPLQLEIVNQFANPKTRLLVTGFTNLQRAAQEASVARATVEVAHEALIRRWETLRKWVNEDRERLRARAAILRAKAEWEEKHQSTDYLLDRGVQLERGRALFKEPGAVPVEDIRQYVDLSIAKEKSVLDAEREADRADQQRIADAERQAREAAEEAERQAKARAEAESRAREAADEAAHQAGARAEAERRAREAAERIAEEQKKAVVAGKRTAQVAVVGLVVAVLVAAVAFWEYSKASAALRDAQITQSRFFAALAQQERELGDAGRGVLLALEALPDQAAGSDRPYVPGAELQLDGALRDLRERLVIGHDSFVLSAAFSPDGKRIVTASWDKTARIWDAATGQPIGQPLKGHDGPVNSAAFSPDGKRIVTASADNAARVWDSATGQPIGEPLKGHEGAVLSAAFSPDGKRIVTASVDKTARVWDAATGQPIGEPLKGHEGAVW